MSSLRTRTDRYVSIESSLAVLVVLLKLHVLYDTWGRVQGFDWTFWMEMFHAMRWFEPIPPALIWSGSYHPPLSYLIGRLFLAVYPHEIEISQVVSTSAILVAFFSIRHVLRHIGWLSTLPGLWLLYGGISIPVIVSVGVETTYDAWVLAWYMLALAIAITLFWHPSSPTWWKNNRTARHVTWLGLVYAAGLLNKYNGLLALALPSLIVLVRRGLKATLRESTAPIVAALVGLVIAFPLYHERYYHVEGRWTPTAMDWQRKSDLKIVRPKRDAEPFTFVANMLRYPLQTPTNPQEPVLDSFIHSSWLHTWFKDAALGVEPEPALTVSRKYSKWFAWATVAGSAWFLLRRRRIAPDWRDLGWLLLSIASIYCVLALVFGWKYPLWDWRVFKTKYMTPVVFWIPYAVAVAFADSALVARRNTWLRWLEDAAFYLLLVFVAVNHLLPVY